MAFLTCLYVLILRKGEVFKFLRRSLPKKKEKKKMTGRNLKPRWPIYEDCYQVTNLSRYSTQYTDTLDNDRHIIRGL